MPLRSQFATLADKFITSSFLDFAKDLHIVEEVRVSDGQGGNTIEYDLFDDVKGFAISLSADEAVKHGGLYTDQMYKFLMRPIAKMTNKMIIKYSDVDCTDNYYRITSIVNPADANALAVVMATKDKDL